MGKRPQKSSPQTPPAPKPTADWLLDAMPLDVEASTNEKERHDMTQTWGFLVPIGITLTMLFNAFVVLFVLRRYQNRKSQTQQVYDCETRRVVSLNQAVGRPSELELEGV